MAYIETAKTDVKDMLLVDNERDAVRFLSCCVEKLLARVRSLEEKVGLSPGNEWEFISSDEYKKQW